MAFTGPARRRSGSLILACFFLLFGCTLARSAESIWMSREELSRLPIQSESWNNVLRHARSPTNKPDLSNQDDQTDTNTMAKALVYARTGDRTYAEAVKVTLQRLIELNPISESLQWNALGALRSIGAYAIAADLVDLESYAPDFDQKQFRPWLDAARYADTAGGRGSIASLQEKRPNNWGTHGSASRIAASLYLRDHADLDRAIQVFRGYLGDRAAYAGFKYGHDLSWQANPDSPIGINPEGSRIKGLSVDGVLPDDARRCGSFSVPPCKTNYMWEGLQGVVASAEMLHRAGYPAFEWSNRAILRAVTWLYTTTFSDGRKFPAEGDDIWMIYIVNKRYGTHFSTGSSATTRPGKMIGFTDWTHAMTDGGGLQQPEAAPASGETPPEQGN